MGAGDSEDPRVVVLFGQSAVGTMTVGQELERLTVLRLFHNHQVIDLLTAYFPFGTPSYDRPHRYCKRRFMEEAAKCGLDLILTTSWRFDVLAYREVIWSWWSRTSSVSTAYPSLSWLRPCRPGWNASAPIGRRRRSCAARGRRTVSTATARSPVICRSSASTRSISLLRPRRGASGRSSGCPSPA